MSGDVQVVVSVHISTTTSGCPKALLDSKVRCSALHTRNCGVISRNCGVISRTGLLILFLDGF